MLDCEEARDVLALSNIPHDKRADGYLGLVTDAQSIRYASLGTHPDIVSHYDVAAHNSRAGYLTTLANLAVVTYQHKAVDLGILTDNGIVIEYRTPNG